MFSAQWMAVSNAGFSVAVGASDEVPNALMASNSTSVESSPVPSEDTRSLKTFCRQSTDTPSIRQNTMSESTRIPYFLAFFALPDCVFGSATTRISSFFVTVLATVRPA